MDGVQHSTGVWYVNMGIGKGLVVVSGANNAKVFLEHTQSIRHMDFSTERSYTTSFPSLPFPSRLSVDPRGIRIAHIFVLGYSAAKLRFQSHRPCLESYTNRPVDEMESMPMYIGRATDSPQHGCPQSCIMLSSRPSTFTPNTSHLHSTPKTPSNNPSPSYPSRPLPPIHHAPPCKANHHSSNPSPSYQRSRIPLSPTARHILLSSLSQNFRNRSTINYLRIPYPSIPLQPPK